MADTMMAQTMESDQQPVNIDNETLREVADFIKNLFLRRQVIYDLEHNFFFTCRIPFRVDYENKTVTTLDGQETIGNEQWSGCEPNVFYELLTDIFRGEWGPTVIDTMQELEKRNIRVDLCESTDFKPISSKEFIDNLKNSLRN